jgi:drug/metabolite transporter (DMT)-like permease
MGILVFSIALQRGSVTTTNAMLFAVETVVPTLIGVVLLGDRARAGRWPAMVIGCGATIVGAVVLALRSTPETMAGPVDPTASPPT